MKLYSITLTLILVFILLKGSLPGNMEMVPDEITVERINIVEPDGKLKMVISNQSRQHPGMIDGEKFGQRERSPGIIFFNEEQDEIGCISYYGNKKIGGNQLFLSFDQYKNDQVMHLMQYTKENGDNKYGLNLWERDKELTMKLLQNMMDSLDNEGLNYRQKMEYLGKVNGGEPIMAQRLFVGKNYNGETGLFIQDNSGVDRLRLYIDSSNQPKFELLNDDGSVIRDILD